MSEPTTLYEKCDHGKLDPHTHLTIPCLGGRERTYRSVWSQHSDGTEYINEELERRVAEAIRRYPNQDAPSWLAPVAAIATVLEWIGMEATDE